MPVSSLITVPQAQAHPLHGQGPAHRRRGHNVTLPRPARAAWLDSDTTRQHRRPHRQPPASEFDAQGTVDMAESQLTAERGGAAPTRLRGARARRRRHRLRDRTRLAGVAHAPGRRRRSPPSTGRPTPNPRRLQSAVRAHKPGDTVTLQVGSIAHPTPGRDVTLRLSASIVENHQKRALPRHRGSRVPSAMGTQPVYDLPFPSTSTATRSAGPRPAWRGPSGIINSLSGGHLTGGQTSPPPGRSTPTGPSATSGAWQQKTVAVERRRGHRVLRPPTGARRGPVHGRPRT